MPRYFPIVDPADPRLDPYRDIRERDLVGREGRFIAEGEVVLKVLARSRPASVLSCLITENRLDALKPTLDTLAQDCPVFVASRAVIERIAGFDIHRGVLALGQKPEPPDLDALLASMPECALVVIAIGIANHDNIGGIFRNAAAFGADAVLLDHGSCDPLYRKAIRVSVGGVFTVPFIRAERTNAEDPFAEALVRNGFERIALSPGADENLGAYRRPDRVAFYLGAEGTGLPRSILDRCLGLSIPMADGFDSLNVATTAGIALHHLQRRA